MSKAAAVMNVIGLNYDKCFFFFFFFFLGGGWGGGFTSFREQQDEAYIGSLLWLTLVEFEPVFTRMQVTHSTTVLRTPTNVYRGWPSLVK